VLFLKDIVEDHPDGPQSESNFEQIYGFFKPINIGL